jgi:hypothetical protein
MLWSKCVATNQPGAIACCPWQRQRQHWARGRSRSVRCSSTAHLPHEPAAVLHEDACSWCWSAYRVAVAKSSMRLTYPKGIPLTNSAVPFNTRSGRSPTSIRPPGQRGPHLLCHGGRTNAAKARPGEARPTSAPPDRGTWCEIMRFTTWLAPRLPQINSIAPQD